METLTLALFVIGLLIVALLLTQTIRRDIKGREQLESEQRYESARARQVATIRSVRAQRSVVVQQHTHKSPQNSV